MQLYRWIDANIYRIEGSSPPRQPGEPRGTDAPRLTVLSLPADWVLVHLRTIALRRAQMHQNHIYRRRVFDVEIIELCVRWIAGLRGRDGSAGR